MAVFAGLVEIQDTVNSLTTVLVNGDRADVLIGGAGQGGDMYLFRAPGDQADTTTATIHIDGERADRDRAQRRAGASYHRAGADRRTDADSRPRGHPPK